MVNAIAAAIIGLLVLLGCLLRLAFIAAVVIVIIFAVRFALGL